MPDKRTSEMLNTLLGKRIVAVGVAKSGGIDYPVINLDDGTELCVQSDDEGNDGGAITIRTEAGTLHHLSGWIFDNVKEGTAVIIGEPKHVNAKPST